MITKFHTIFKNIGYPYWNALENHPKVMLKINSELKKLGIKKVINENRYYDCRDLYFKEITLVIRPKINHEDQEKPISETFGKILRTKGWRNGYSYWHHSNFGKYKEFFYKGKPLGCYIPEANLIIIYYMAFDCYWDREDPMAFLFLDCLKKAWKGLKVKKVDIEKFLIQRNAEEFFKQVKNKISSLTRSNINYKDEITHISQNTVDYIKKIELNLVQARTLEKLVEKKTVNLFKIIEELKKIPFVHSAKLDMKGINVDVGEIKIFFKGKKYWVGDFTIHILPESVNITNKYPVKTGSDSSDTYNHPHVKGKPCFGTYSDKVSKLLGALKFRELIYLVYTFLKSYASDDCYINLEKFAKLVKAKKEGKPIDED